MALSAVAGVACGSSNGSSASQMMADASETATDAGQCPASVARTIGAACQAEGLYCAPTYDCALVQVPLSCTCMQGLFVCIDGAGNTVDAGGTPGCPAPLDASCPSTETSATMAACSEVGLMCSYPSACEGGVDSCECMAGSLVTGGGPNLVFTCQQATCSSPDAGAPVEGGVITAEGGVTTAEGGAVSTLDAGQPHDAGVAE